MPPTSSPPDLLELRRILDDAPVVLWVADAEGSCVFMSRRWRELTGQEPDEAVGEGWVEMVHPDDRQSTWWTFLEASSRREPCRLDYRLRGRDGRYRWVTDSASPRFDDEGTFLGYVGSTVDLTSRREAEEALRASEQSYRALFETVTEAIYIQDEDGVFLDVNGAAARMYGLERDDIVGRTPEVLADPERLDLEATLRHVRRARAGEPQRFEWWGRRVDGQSFPKEVSLTRGQYFGQDVVIAVARDMSERCRAEDALRQSEERYRTLVETAHEGIWVLDVEGRTTFANRRMAEMLGWTPEEMVGVSLDAFLDEEDRREMEAHLERRRRRRGDVQELRFRHRDGREVWMLVSTSPLEDEDGEYRGALGMMVDVTTRKELEVRLRQAQKMEAVGRLAGGIAHDFNNLLTAISGHSQMALEQISRSDPARVDVEEVIRAAERAAALVGQLLAFSRRQVLQPEILDLNESVRGTLRMLERVIGEDVRLATHLDPELAPIRADRSQVEQVIVNLAINARDAMPTGGRLRLSTRTEVVEAGGLHTRDGVAIAPGRYALLSVEDTGLGMNARTLERIFEPFFTTKAAGRGTGLGLSTVYGIVKQSGGYVFAESEPGRGARFDVLLPEAVLEEDAGFDAGTASPGGRVLLVADEARLRRTGAAALEREGYRVETAITARDALERVEASGARFDALVTDLVLPDMGGRELADRVLLVAPGTRVVLVSGYAADPGLRRRIDRGEIGFVEKPCAAGRLARAVHDALAARGEEPLRCRKDTGDRPRLRVGAARSGAGGRPADVGS